MCKKPHGNNSTNQPNGWDQKCGWGSSQNTVSITVQSHLPLLGEFSLAKSSHLYRNLEDRKFLQRFPCADFPKGSRRSRKFQKTALFESMFLHRYKIDNGHFCPRNFTNVTAVKHLTKNECAFLKTNKKTDHQSHAGTFLTL